MSEKYQLEELDSETRDYLLFARDNKGKGAPGMFAGKSFYLPAIGLAVGFVIMIVTVFLTFPPTEHPVREAMLQTAGFLVGGWMIVAALRVWAGSKMGGYAGHFVYADPENLYEAKGSTVEITDLYDLRDAKAIQNFNDGKYQNTDINLKIGKLRHSVQVSDEERGRRMAVFLNTVAYMRDGGEDGNDDELRKLSPESMGAVAKQVAKTGEFPRRLSDAEDAEMVRVPQPKREGRKSIGLIGILGTLIVGAVLFLGFRAINTPLRDHAIFNKIQAIPGKDQAPALRLYLANPSFTRHREEAKNLLAGHYERGVNANVLGTDPEMKKAMGDVILALKDMPAPVISFITAEEQSPEGPGTPGTTREAEIQRKLADKWGATIGDELVVFVAPSDPDKPEQMDKSLRGMIDLRWRYLPEGLEYTLEFRKAPDEKPFFSRTGRQPHNAGADATAHTMADRILEMTVGATKLRPMVPADF
jgi:hypothetical protein